MCNRPHSTAKIQKRCFLYLPRKARKNVPFPPPSAALALLSPGVPPVWPRPPLWPLLRHHHHPPPRHHHGHHPTSHAWAPHHHAWLHVHHPPRGHHRPPRCRKLHGGRPKRQPPAVGCCSRCSPWVVGSCSGRYGASCHGPCAWHGVGSSHARAAHGVHGGWVVSRVAATRSIWLCGLGWHGAGFCSVVAHVCTRMLYTDMVSLQILLCCTHNTHPLLPPQYTHHTTNPQHHSPAQPPCCYWQM